MTNRRFPIDPYRPAQPAPPVPPTLRAANLEFEGYTETERAETRAHMESLRQLRMRQAEEKLRLEYVAETMAKSPYETEGTNRSRVVKPLTTVEQANKDFADIQNAFLKPKLANSDPNNMGAANALIKTTTPSFWKKVGDTSGQAWDWWYSKMNKPAAGVPYWGLVQLERMNRKAMRLPTTPEQDEELRIANEALSASLREIAAGLPGSGLYGKFGTKKKPILHPVLGKSPDEPITWQDRSQFIQEAGKQSVGWGEQTILKEILKEPWVDEETENNLQTAWASNPLPKYQLGAAEAIFDPINLMSGGPLFRYAWRAVKLGFKPVRALGGAVLSKAARKTLDPANKIDDILEADPDGLLNTVGKEVDPWMDPGIEDEVSLLTKWEEKNLSKEAVDSSIELIRGSARRALPVDSPWSDRFQMSQLGDITRRTFRAFSKFIPGLHNPSKKIDPRDELSKAVIEMIDDGQRSTHMLGTIIQPFRHYLDDKTFKLRGSNDMRVENIQRQDPEYWARFIGEKATVKGKETYVRAATIGVAKKGFEKSTGLIDDEIITLQKQVQLRKKQVQIHKSVPSKVRKTQEVLLDSKRMPANKAIAVLDEAIEAQEHQIKMYEQELKALRKLVDIDQPMLGDVIEWQNFFKFTPRQLEALDVYNNSYLKFMQSQFMRAGAPKEELKHVLTGRVYFPRASSEVWDDVLKEFVKRPTLLLTDNMPRAGKKTALRERTFEGAMEEGPYLGFAYDQDPIKLMEQAGNAVIKWRNKAEIENLIPKIISKAMQMGSELVKTDKNAIVMKGLLAKAIKARFFTPKEEKFYGLLTPGKVRKKPFTRVGGKADELTAGELDTLLKRGQIDDLSTIHRELVSIDDALRNNQDAADLVHKALAYATKSTDIAGSEYAAFATANKLELFTNFKELQKIQALASKNPGVGFGPILRQIKDPNYIFDSSDIRELTTLSAQLRTEYTESLIGRSNSLARAIKIEEDLLAESKNVLGDGLRVSSGIKRTLDDLFTKGKEKDFAFIQDFRLNDKGELTRNTVVNVLQTAGMKPVQLLNNVSQVLRYWGTAFDAGWAAIQGIYLLTSGVQGAKAWGRIWIEFAKAVSGPEWKGFNAQLFVNKRAIQQDGVRHGLIQTGTEETEAILSANFAVRLGVQAPEWILKQVSKVGFTYNNRRFGISIQNMPLLFRESANYGRLELYEGYVLRAHAHALEKIGVSSTEFAARQNDVALMTRYADTVRLYKEDIADLVNKMTGAISTAKYGISPAQQVAETSLLFAPRFVRSQMSLMSDIVRGQVKGEIAREALGKAIGGGIIMYTALCLASGQEPLLDPRPKKFGGDGGNAFSWKIPGTDRRLSVAGTMNGSIKMMFRLVSTGTDGDVLAAEFDKDWGEQMWTRFVINKTSPGINLGEAIMKGETYSGHSLEWKGDGWGDKTLAAAESFGVIANENLTPFFTTALLDGPEGSWGSKVAGGASEYAGFSSWVEAPWKLPQEIKNIKAQELGYESWDQLDKDQQRQIEDTTPELRAAQEIADESDWYTSPSSDEYKRKQEYYEGREEIESERREYLDDALRPFVNERPGEDARDIIDEYKTHSRLQTSKLVESISGIKEDFNKERNPEDKLPYLEAGRLAYRDAITLSTELFNKRTGKYDWEQREAIEEALSESYGRELLPYIERQWLETNSEAHPLEVELHLSKKLLKSYWQLDSIVIQRLVEDENMNVSQVMYDEWKDIKAEYGAQEAMARYGPQVDQDMKEVDRVITLTKETYRKEHADKERILYRWGYTSTLLNEENIQIGKYIIGRRPAVNVALYLNTQAERAKLDNNEQVQ